MRGGYETVAWLSGGFDAATAADFDTSNGKDMRFGAVGGLSGALGLSDVQREEAALGRTVPGWVRAVAYAGGCSASDAAAVASLLCAVTGHASHRGGADQLAQRHLAHAAQAVAATAGTSAFLKLLLLLVIPLLSWNQGRSMLRKAPQFQLCARGSDDAGPDDSTRASGLATPDVAPTQASDRRVSCGCNR